MATAWQGETAQPLSALPPEQRRALQDGTADVTAALRPGTTLLVPLKLPFFPSSKLCSILPNLLATRLPFPLSECFYRFTMPARPETKPDKDHPVLALAHVARVSDLQRRLRDLQAAGCDPARLVPPGPAAWLQLVKERPLPDDTPRALFLVDAEKTLLATGRGARLANITVFATDPSGTQALRHLRLAFGGLPAALSVAFAGPAAAPVATSLPQQLPATATATSLPRPESFLARALAAPQLESLNFRTGSLARTGSHRLARRCALAAAAVFLLASVLALALAVSTRASLDRELSAARRDRAAALAELAGAPVSARGQAAIQIARTAAAAAIDPVLLQPDVTERVPAVLDAARANGIRLAHFRLDEEGLAASGKAPSPDAIRAFLRALVPCGISANPDEQPRAEADGTYSFFVHAGGRSE